MLFSYFLPSCRLFFLPIFYKLDYFSYISTNAFSRTGYKIFLHQTIPRASFFSCFSFLKYRTIIQIPKDKSFYRYCCHATGFVMDKQKQAIQQINKINVIADYFYARIGKKTIAVFPNVTASAGFKKI